MSRRWIAPLLGLLAAAAPAHGQLSLLGPINSVGIYPEFIPCQPSCVETRSASVYDGTRTTFYWFLRNHQGSQAAGGATPVNALPGEVRFYVPANPTAVYGLVAGHLLRPFGHVDQFTIRGPGTLVPFGQQVNPAPDVPGPHYLALEIHGKVRFYGCDLPAEFPSFLYGYYQTCLEDGRDGWLAVTLRANGEWTLNDLRVTGVGSGPVQVQVTPEPASMALLGTGLAGLAGAARRRRRRQEDSAA